MTALVRKISSPVAITNRPQQRPPNNSTKKEKASRAPAFRCFIAEAEKRLSDS